MPNDITNIPAPRVSFIDPRTGLMAREWYRFFFNLFELTGGGQNSISIEDLQLSPAAQDTLGELGIVYDQAQLASMMAQYQEAARSVQNQIDTQPALPQLGTLSAVNEDNVRLIGFSNNPSPAVPNPAPTGTLYWDGNSTLGLQMNQSVLVRIGQAQFVYVKASASITKGQLCKHTGSVGASGVIAAAPTSTSMTDPVQIVGVAAQDIALNAFGFIQVSGDIRGFDTTGTSVGEVWADGDPLYYNPSFVGGLTKTKPSAPNIKTYIGEVINAGSGGSGSINIRIVYGSVLGGTDANVQFGALADKDLIQYDSALQYWKNVAPSSIAIGSASSISGGTAGAVPYQSAPSTTTFLSIGTAGQVLAVNAGATAPQWDSTTGTGNVVRATSPTLTTPVLGTPTSGTLTNCTGLPISTGVSGLGANVATFLATPSSANLAAAVTDETGSGSLVFGTSPSIATPTLTGTVTVSSLTSGRVPYATTGGALTDSANLLYSGTDLTVYSVRGGRGPGAISTTLCVGNGALNVATTAPHTTAIGYRALYNVSTNGYVTAVGSSAGYNTTTLGAIYGAVYVGYRAGYSNQTGQDNCFVGGFAGDATTGGNNTFIGGGSGYLVTTGAKNTILGSFTGNSSGLDIRTLSNYIVLSDGDGNPRWITDNNGATGYSPGTGGAVTQATSRTTGVTLNKSNGAITLVSAAGSATYQTFTVTNSTVAATDTIIVNQKSGTDKYIILVTAVAAGSFKITFATTGGTTTEQPVFNFAVIKANTA